MAEVSSGSRIVYILVCIYLRMKQYRKSVGVRCGRVRWRAWSATYLAIAASSDSCRISGACILQEELILCGVVELSGPIPPCTHGRVDVFVRRDDTKFSAVRWVITSHHLHQSWRSEGYRPITYGQLDVCVCVHTYATNAVLPKLLAPRHIHAI